jgi:hypothetical protein
MHALRVDHSEDSSEIEVAYSYVDFSNVDTHTGATKFYLFVSKYKSLKKLTTFSYSDNCKLTTLYCTVRECL